MIKRVFFSLLFGTGVHFLVAITPTEPRLPLANRAQNFVANHLDFAQIERDKFGIPVCITLAQAILESAYGESEMAKLSNNYFCIKCHNDWKGDTIMVKDDDYEGKNLVESCFRVYDSVEESFRDHSLLLQNKRYQKYVSLLSITDYKGWAHALKAAGYATSPTYAEDLIRIIEQYHLEQYDAEKSADSPDFAALRDDFLPPPPSAMRQRVLFEEMRPQFEPFVLR